MNYRDLSVSLAEVLIRSQAESDQLTSHAGQQGPRPPFTITISREAGALGSSVGAELARRLDWPVYDGNILDKIAEELRRPPSHLEGVDERPASWFGEALSALLDKFHVASTAYFKSLFAVVRGLGVGGRCVIVGRGANFILPAERSLRVRLVAREEDRVQVVAKRLGVSTRDAAAWVGKTERDRTAFSRTHFKADAANPLHYHLVLNMSCLSGGEAAEVIIETLRRLERPSVPAGQTKRPPADQGQERGQPASPTLP